MLRAAGAHGNFDAMSDLRSEANLSQGAAAAQPRRHASRGGHPRDCRFAAAAAAVPSLHLTRCLRARRALVRARPSLTTLSKSERADNSEQVG